MQAATLLIGHDGKSQGDVIGLVLGEKMECHSLQHPTLYLAFLFPSPNPVIVDTYYSSLTIMASQYSASRGLPNNDVASSSSSLSVCLPSIHPSVHPSVVFSSHHNDLLPSPPFFFHMAARTIGRVGGFGGRERLWLIRLGRGWESWTNLKYFPYFRPDLCSTFQLRFWMVAGLPAC